MTDQLSRITVRDATLSGPIAGQITIIGYVTEFEPEAPANDNAIDAVAASLREFGFRQPIVVDTEGVIIVGHARHKAAIKMGLQKVPVHVATDLTPEQVRAYRIADSNPNALQYPELVRQYRISSMYWKAISVRKFKTNKEDIHMFGIHVHHIIPWSQSPKLRYEPSNGVCLCSLCHKKITGHEMIYAPMLFAIVQANIRKQDNKTRGY